MGAQALADPLYTAIDLGTINPYTGAVPNGNGTITGSNGLTYAFNPVQNDLPAQWDRVSQGVPIVQPAPVNGPGTNGNPNFAFSYSYLYAMNSQGLAVGINQYGVAGHLENSEVFLTQKQPNGSWGTPTPLWPGLQYFDEGNPYGLGIFGMTPTGQVLGYGVANPYQESPAILYLYDTKTQTLTNLNNVINSVTWTNSTNLPNGQSPYWNLNSPLAQFDSSGRILVQATQGYGGTPHALLLVPQGVSVDPLAIPEPATWAVFATLIGGWMAHQRLRTRTRSWRTAVSGTGAALRDAG
ncbi:MAG TPA: hypothetical protein VFF52_25080 [Isosphaeraceae bacterium]|nr:hypothetical protein [Isosphaeraceae bacterium]